jgi:hypothetical protein
MKLRKSVLICGIISAMMIGYIFAVAVRENRCWYSTLHHYKSVIGAYAKQVFS